MNREATAEQFAQEKQTVVIRRLDDVAGVDGSTDRQQRLQEG